MLIEDNERFVESLELVKKANLNNQEIMSLIGIKKVVLDKTDKKRKSLQQSRYDRPDVLPNDTKFCHVCGKLKDVSEFYKGQTRCKVCDAHYKRSYKTYRDKFNKARREKRKLNKQHDEDN